MDRRAVLFISVPVVMAALILFFINSKKFAPPLSATENELADFSSGAVPAVNIRQRAVAALLESPIKIPTGQIQKREFPGTPLSQAAPAPGRPLNLATPPAAQPVSYVVSLILENGGSKRAIINGIVVKEGDMIGGGKVEIIEKNRVLLTDKKESRWIKIE